MYKRQVLGRTIEGVAKFVTVAGGVITKIEEGVNAAVQFLLKPMMPVLEPLLKPLAGVMERMGGFLRKLFNIAEKDAAQVATTAAAKTLGAAHPAPPAPHLPTAATPHPHAPTPHPHAPAAKTPTPGAGTPHGAPHPAPKPAAEPHPAAKPAKAPDTSAAPHADPHAPAAKTPDPQPQAKAPEAHKPEPKAPHSASDAAHKPITEPDPVGGGHHVQTTPDGFELCSGPPCPNLRVMYKEQLAASDELRREMQRLDTMRKIALRQEAQLGKTDPAFAKRINREAAELQKKLEAAKLGKPSPVFAPAASAPIGPKVKNPSPQLKTGPYKKGSGSVAGHHVHQSAAMSPPKVASAKGNPNHNPAIAIEQNVPGFTGKQHEAASATQRNINRAIHGEPHEPKIGKVKIEAKGAGANVTPSPHMEDVKAYYALRAAGRSHEEALELVMRSRAQIEAAGAPTLRVPTR